MHSNEYHEKLLMQQMVFFEQVGASIIKNLKYDNASQNMFKNGKMHIIQNKIK